MANNPADRDSLDTEVDDGVDGTASADNRVTQYHNRGMVYESRRGDSVEILSKRFSIRPADVLDYFSQAKAEDFEPGSWLYLRNVDDVHVQIDTFVHREYARTSAEVHGVSEEDLIKECLERSDQVAVREAYARFRDVWEEEFDRWSGPRFDTRRALADQAKGFGGFALGVLALAAAIAGLLQWRGIWDVGWDWFIGLAIAFLLAVLAGLGLEESATVRGRYRYEKRRGTLNRWDRRAWRFAIWLDLGSTALALLVLVAGVAAALYVLEDMPVPWSWLLFSALATSLLMAILLMSSSAFRAKGRQHDERIDHNTPNDWDRRGEMLTAPIRYTAYIVVPLLVVFLVASLLQLLGIWAEPPLVVLALVAAVPLVILFVELVLAGLFLQRSRAYDERHLDWRSYPRLRDFHSAVSVGLLAPALRSLARADFRTPANDPVRANGSRLTSTPMSHELVQTDTYRRILRRIARSDGATIGIRGSRGAGKSALMRSFCDPQKRAASTSVTRQPEALPSDVDADHDSTEWDSSGDEPLGIFIPAPASLGDDFFRRIALLICERTRDIGGKTPSTTGSQVPWQFVLPPLAVALVGLLIVSNVHTRVRTTEIGWMLFVVGLGVSGVVLVVSMLRRRRLQRAAGDRSLESFEAKQTREELLQRARDQATELRRRLRYVQTESQNVEASVSVQGIGGKVARSVARSETPLTKDVIVDELSSVISTLNDAGRRVVIGIDELDKLDADDESVPKLLNAMKSLFATTSASFLISISTSAWTSFEQRGLQLRNVFDSSFDEIVEVRAFSFLDARSLIRQRQAEFTDSQVLFINVTAGGVARDILRYARQLAEIGESERSEVSLSAASIRFIELEKDRKLEAAILEARGQAETSETERLIDKLERLSRSWPDLTAEALLTKLEDLDSEGQKATRGERLPGGDRNEVIASDRLKRQEGDAAAPPYGIDAMARTIAYLAFLRLLERAFSDNGAIGILSQQPDERFEQMPDDVIGAFEKLQRAREKLVLGRTTARLYLTDALVALDKVGNLMPTIPAVDRN